LLDGLAADRKKSPAPPAITHSVIRYTGIIGHRNPSTNAWTSRKTAQMPPPISHPRCDLGRPRVNHPINNTLNKTSPTSINLMIYNPPWISLLAAT
jgi:hypothetical protein